MDNFSSLSCSKQQEEGKNKIHLKQPLPLNGNSCGKKVMIKHQVCQREEAGNLERTNSHSVQPGWHLHEYTEITDNSYHGIQNSSLVYSGGSLRRRPYQ